MASNKKKHTPVYSAPELSLVLYLHAQFHFKLDLSFCPIMWGMGMYWRFVPPCSNPLRR